MTAPSIPRRPAFTTNRRTWTGPALAFGGLLLAWHLAAASGLVVPFLLPGPEAVARVGLAMLLDGSLARHAAVSMLRILSGFALSVCFALPLAALLALNGTARRVIDGPLEFLRHIPPLALLPLVILWFGIGEGSKLAIIVLATFFPVFVGTLGGIAQCDPKLVEVGRMCGLPRREILTRIVFPAALPAMLIGLRLGLGYSWRALVGAELVAASSGLGYMIIDAETLARTDIIFVGILVIGLLGMVLDAATRAAARRLAPWIRQEVGLVGG